MGDAAKQMLEPTWPFACSLSTGDQDGDLVTHLRLAPHHLLHAGMTLNVHVGPNDENVEQFYVVDVNPDTGDVELSEAVDRRQVEGKACTVASRQTPCDWQDWTTNDILCTIETLYEMVWKADVYDVKTMLEIIQTEDVSLMGAETTIKDLEVAWTEQRRWLERIRTLGVEKGLLGPRAQDKRYSMHMRAVIHGMNAMYEALYAIFVIKQAQGGQPKEQGPNDTAVNPWWLSTAPPDQPKKDSNGNVILGTTQLIEFFLACAFRDNIRKNVQGVVFEEVMTTVVDVVREADQPRCCAKLDPGTGRKLSPADPQEQGQFIECREPAVWAEAPGGSGADGSQAVKYRTDCFCSRHRTRKMVNILRDQDGSPYPMCTTTVLAGTKAWRPRISPHSGRPMMLEEWMETVLDRTTNYDMWAAMMSNYGAHKSSCSKALLGSNDGCLGFVTRNPVWYSFRNGVYNIETNTFLPYGDPAIPKDLCTANFIDQDLEPEWTLMDPQELVVEAYDNILDCQQYSPAMKEWIDVFFGRLFFPLGLHDKWEKLMIIKGFAATGKSTIAKAIATLIGEENVGYIASNCEEQWALANVADKAIWMCLELKSGFRLPTGTMQSMVSGENVVVNEKYKTAYTMAWKQPGLLVGNELPVSWSQDVANALARRILPFPFDIAPSTQDAGLAPRLMRDMSKMFVRMTRRYMLRSRELGRAALDPHLPPELRASMTDFAKLSSPLRTMLETGDDFTMASPEEKVLIMWEIAVAQNAPKNLGLNAVELKKLREDYARIIRTNGIDNGSGAGTVALQDKGPDGQLVQLPAKRRSMELLHVYSTSPTDIARAFKAYCIANNIKSSIDINNRDNYIAASRAMQTPVASCIKVLPMFNDNVQPVMQASRKWYGLRVKDQASTYDNSWMSEGELSDARKAYDAVFPPQS